MIFETLRSADRPDEPGRVVIFREDPDGRHGEPICMLPEAIGEQLREAIEADLDRAVTRALEETCARVGEWFSDQVRMRAGLPIPPADFTRPLPAHMHIPPTDSPSVPPGDPLIDLDAPRSLRPW